ncbi:ArsR/SmtB family transcription factor [Streptomyces sp. NBC_01314]|uniref:ArsR/SmtB family transcription factor n=1 Tax=Streptomyces sp. NBC_01314 TaxID=2903821 RepID=UPI00308B0E79|nr:ArsR family transcriptional regulator [Streptomyces sp. NBC_01314]
MFAGLRPRLEWQPPLLRIPVYADQKIHLDGRGIVLVPSFLCRIQPIMLLDSTLPPVLVYPVKPQFGWLRPTTSTGETSRAEALGALLGRARGAVLEAAAAGGNTSQPAQRAGVALPVVSRHTAVLREAGLLSIRRRANSAYHRATPLGLARTERPSAPLTHEFAVGGKHCPPTGRA